MDIITAIIFGIVQGTTEFLPVSSSGHLVIFARLLDVPSSFEFDVLINFGTLLAMMLYFRSNILQLFRDILISRRWDTLMKLIAATVPAAMVGYFAQDLIKQYLHSTWVAVVMLFIIGVLMVLSRSWKPNSRLAVNKDVRDISMKNAIIIGLAQCISLISGSSRSGTTILASLRLGINREKAAEWSFMMGMPIIFGASLKVLLSSEGQSYISENLASLLIGNAASFISGMLAVSLLMKLLHKYGLYWFGWYRVALAGVLILLLSVNII